MENILHKVGDIAKAKASKEQKQKEALENHPLFGKTIMKKVEHPRSKPVNFIIPAPGI